MNRPNRHLTLLSLIVMQSINPITAFCHHTSPNFTINNVRNAVLNHQRAMNIPFLQRPGWRANKTSLKAEHDIDNIESLEELNEICENIGGPNLLECASIEEARDILWDYAQEAAESDDGHDHDHNHHHHHDHE